MGVQSRYLDTFAGLKRDAIYINIYHAKTEKFDRRLNVFSALTLSGAIGGWAIWQQLHWLWAVAIAGSQVLSAAKPYLPYRTRLKALSGLGTNLEALALTAESDWFKVSEGLLTAEEVHELTIILKRKLHSATKKNFLGMSLPDDEGLLAHAEEEATARLGVLVRRARSADEKPNGTYASGEAAKVQQTSSDQGKK